MSYFQRKTPKSQQIDKSIYTCYNPHTINLSERKWDNLIRIISIDPGIRNFAIRIEERSIKSNNFPIKTLYFDKLRIKDADRELTPEFECKIYKILTEFLNQQLKLFKTCHMVIIEKQMPFNYKAIRIAQHTLTYFMIHLQNIKPNLAMIFELDSKLKGKELGASTHLNERGLKLWSVEKAKELLKIRNDDYGLKILEKHKKKADDLADTICQIEALFSYNSWPFTKEPIIINII